MNQAVREYVASVVERHLVLVKGARVLEIGAYDVNGTVRDLFESAGCAAYVGVDKRMGPGVGQVINAHEISEKLPCWLATEVVICCEMLEHDSDPFKTAEQIRLLSPKLLIVTARGRGYPPHDTPEDYWRFMSDGLRIWFERAGFPNAEIIDHVESMGVFGSAVR